jgi:hypothetical protein
VTLFVDLSSEHFICLDPEKNILRTRSEGDGDFSRAYFGRLVIHNHSLVVAVLTMELD